MFLKSIFGALCLFILAASARGEVIDRIVAVVDGHIITSSDVRQERETLARLGDKPIVDDKALVRQMIDNYLIETQIADTPGIDVSEAEVDAELQNVPAGAGPPSKAVREAVRQRIRMRKYLEVRFGQYIRPSDEDIRKYYNDVFMPAAKEKGLNPVPPLEQVADLIRTNVRQEGLNHELNIWLEAFHRRSNIEVFE